MENIPSQEETSFGVLDHDVVRSSLEALTKKKNWKKLVTFRMKSVSQLDNMLQFMDLMSL